MAECLKNFVIKCLLLPGYLVRKFGSLVEGVGYYLQKLGQFLERPCLLLQSSYQSLGNPNELKSRKKLQRENEELQDEIERRKSQFMLVWREAPLYPDWKKERCQCVKVILDETTAHPSLLISKNRTQVTWQEICQDLTSSTHRFDSLPCVLGKLYIDSGRYYWQVKVEDAWVWDVGICKSSIKRTGRLTISPQKGFWAIRLYNGKYWAVTSPETILNITEKPLWVGVFLDFEAGYIAFYNMTNNSHIFTFPSQNFSGGLRPFFRLWSIDSGTLSLNYDTVTIPISSQ